MNAGTKMRAKADARSRTASLVVITLLIGLAGAVSMAAFAGARRSATAYERFRAETNEPEVILIGGRGAHRVDPGQPRGDRAGDVRSTDAAGPGAAGGVTDEALDEVAGMRCALRHCSHGWSPGLIRSLTGERAPSPVVARARSDHPRAGGGFARRPARRTSRRSSPRRGALRLWHRGDRRGRPRRHPVGRGSHPGCRCDPTVRGARRGRRSCSPWSSR